MFGNPDQAHEYFSDSDAITCTASGAVTGKTFVKLAAGGSAQNPVVVTAAAGDPVYGVAAWSVIDGELVTILRKGVIGVTAGAAVVPGPVQAGANGKAVNLPAETPGQIVGHAHADAANDGEAVVALTL